MIIANHTQITSCHSQLRESESNEHSDHSVAEVDLNRGLGRQKEGQETRQTSNRSNASDAFYCDSHTGGSCRFWSCSSSRGPTTCSSSQCRCKPGFCAVAGVCTERTAHVADTCNRDTGGSCRFFGCSSYRGAVDCIDGSCVCKVGTCSADDGSCHQPKVRIKANVWPVNLENRQFPPSQAAQVFKSVQELFMHLYAILCSLCYFCILLLCSILFNIVQ